MFNRYTITENIYRGVKSNVSRATRDEDGAKVIIKSLAETQQKPIDIARLKHEYQLIEHIKLLGIPEVISFESKDNHYGIVFKEFNGISLKSYLKNEQPDIGFFLNIAIQLCNILAGLHVNRIIHKDIKPANIIIDPESLNIQLVDFSLSTRSFSGQHVASGTGILEGSLAYISPEQTGRMNRPIDYRSDLYSLGITLYEILTGQLPFHASHPLEWVHAHLAQKPPDPRTYRPDFPQPIAEIIMILLAKTSEDRYQSAYNLKKDFEKAAIQWKVNEKIMPFDLSAFDTYGLFMLPARLYGREKAIRDLSDIMSEVVQKGESKFMLLSGYSGIGKTLLVQEARKQVSIAKGHFCSGKFEQLNKGVPYFGIIEAFTNLSKQFLTEEEVDIELLKSRLVEAIGNNAQIINKLVPSFELILGKHPDPPSLLPEAASNRFLLTLKNFVKTLAWNEKPLIIFLDDLQWADMASLTLLEILASDTELKSLGIIVSYRSNEVDDAHPLMQSIKKIREKIQVKEIVLENLTIHDIENLLNDSFKCSAEKTCRLAQLLLDKTQGNPFFIVQALNNYCEEDVIHFEINTGSWDWDFAKLSKMNISDNMVDLMVSKIQKLNFYAQESLQLAACIGNTFSLSLLSWISKPESMLQLNEALEQGLIISQDDNYVILSDEDRMTDIFFTNRDASEIQNADAKFRFLHDRVQQAAYSMLKEEETKAIHYKLGHNLSQYLDEVERAEQIFSICNHLNQGREHITTIEEKLKLATLNLQAAQRAKGATAYLMALQYGKAAISLLPDDAQKQEYTLWQGLNFVTAECYYILGEVQKAEKVFGLLLHGGQKRMDKLLVYRAMVDMYSMSAEREKVIKTVAAALSLFGIRMPVGALESKMRILETIVEIKWRLRNKTNEDIISGPVCIDTDHIKLAELLLEAGPSVYLSNLDIFAWLVLFEVRYALRLGNTPTSALGFTGYGMIIHAAFGDTDMAFRMAELGEKLNHKLGDPFPYYKLKFVNYLFISHFRVALASTINDAGELSKHALDAGDSLYNGISRYYITICQLFIGHSIPEILEQSKVHLKQLRELNNEHGYELIQCRLHALMVLHKEQPLPWIIDGKIVSLDEKIEQFKLESGFTNLALFYTSIYTLYYLLDDNADKISLYLEDGLKYLNYVEGSVSYFDFGLYQTLSVFKMHRTNHPKARHHKKIIKHHRDILKKHWKKGPENFECYYLLVDMCWQIINCNGQEIIYQADRLIEAITNKHQNHLVAICKEIIGQLYADSHLDKIARVYLTESAIAYDNWGATAKRTRMLDEYASLQLKLEDEIVVIEDAIEDTHTTHHKYSLDLASLMKSATTISGEIILDKLLPSMINIVVENAGANKGILILNQNDQLILKMKREIGKPDAEFLENQKLDQSNELAQTVVQLTQRTLEPVLADNALFDERFKLDPYVMVKKSKSILCMPIIHQGSFMGAIYLENELMSYGFSSERVDVIKILCSQIAVSLDNALLYLNLQEALEKQVSLTEAYSRFTPRAYLKFLGHESILDVKLGDYRVEKMTVLFSDIRSYTTIAEQFSSEENFLFISNYLKRMSEIIARHQGMVNQLLGDGILAFFDNAQHAIDASIEMQQVLQTYLVKRKQGDTIKINAGIGLHSGEVIIGIMGSANSMDTGIVSDTVNAASRIEGLTKHFGLNILLSEAVLKQLDANTQKNMRSIGRVIMKGKQNEISIYECFSGDTEEIKLLKQLQLTSYHDAFSDYCNQNFISAKETFSQLAKHNHLDPLLTYYLKKATELLNANLPKDWTAVEDIQIK